MGDGARKIVEEALRLPEDERTDVVDAILASLPEHAARVEAEWAREIEARAARALAGEPGVSAAQVHADLRAKLRR